MDKLQDIFVMPMFPHIYAIPVSVLFGIAIGYYLRGRIEGGEQKLPPKPKVD